MCIRDRYMGNNKISATQLKQLTLNTMKTSCLLLLPLFLSTALLSVHAKTKEEWKSRAIYQILTDRFARSDGVTSQCPDLHSYCGGDFKGIIQKLDYIKDLGFDAIWISPVVENLDNGYHGYWATNLYNVNPHFGSKDDLKALVAAAHAKDIWVMVDVVGNHMGPVGQDYRNVIPFNRPEHYHDYCIIQNEDFARDQWRVENCRLADLPDLKQENPYVANTILSWITDLVHDYQLDGIRIDTIPEVPRDFWSKFSAAAGVYTIGECFDPRYAYVARYQGAVDALLNYPLYFAIKYIFGDGDSMFDFREHFDQMSAFQDQSVLGTFVDNHDNARFLHSFPDNKNRYWSALTFSLTTVGIPIMYYGSEYYYAGGNDPENREVLWTVFNIKTDMQDRVKAILKLRKTSQFWKSPQVERYVDDHFYAFTRENIFFAFTNQNADIKRTITYEQYPEGTTLCNIFYPGVDCVKVQNGKFDVILLGGEPKIFVPQKSHAEKFLAVTAQTGSIYIFV
eukprot:TRINITY_DN462_c0_g1_i6.p1 TRINITY_DN462_c0_g1~~TRINITY_DN462_c0_g1_i6.p1  ORF type:complete len:556 (-),score=162.19 TRINITY_DN462_c0_g1_i6:424-1950(-)